MTPRNKVGDLIKYGTPPEEYKNRPLQTVIWTNITAHIRFSYESDYSKYAKSFIRGLMKHCKMSEEDALSKARNLNRQYMGHGSRLISEETVSLLCLAFSLPDNSFWTEKEPNELNYILLEICPQHTKDIFTSIVDLHAPYIDEVSVVAGQYAIFIRMFGPRQAVADFTFNVLKDIDPKNHIVSSMSMRGFLSDHLVYERYPNASHPLMQHKRPSWLPINWVAP